MKLRARHIAGTTIASFLVLFFYAWFQWNQIEERQRTDSIATTLWFTNQADYESQRLALSLYRAIDGEGNEDARTRIEILFSRVGLMTDPSQDEQMAHIGVTEELDQVERLLDEVDALYDPPSAEAATRALPAALEAGGLLHQIANATALAERVTRQESREEKVILSRLLMIAASGIFLVGMLMAAQMWLGLRKAQSAEAELRRHRDALEDLVAARTAELHKALTMERRAKEVYRSFIITVSHQFRTPLAIIDMIARRLSRDKEGQFSDATKIKLGRILESSDRLTELVNGFIETASLEEGPTPLQAVRLDPIVVMEDVVAAFRKRYPDREIIFNRPEGADVQLDADPKLLKRAFSNLLQNAINFSQPPTKIEVNARITNEAISLSVSDEGLGIPSSAQADVFEPYYRAENAHVLPGVGIGLSQSHDIIKAHQGDILLRSEQGVGSEFTVLLPRLGRRIDVDCPGACDDPLRRGRVFPPRGT